METEKRFRKVSVWIDQDLRRYVAIIPVLFFVLGTGLAGKGLAEQPFLATDSTQKIASEAALPMVETPLEEKLYTHQRLFRSLFDPIIDRYPPEESRKNLGLDNFFDYGWTQGWAEPDEGPDDAPRFRLLQIQRAFWERELRLTYNYTFGADDGEADEQEGEFELELPISRRFLVEFEWGIVGLKPDGQSWEHHGGDLKIIPEVMLAETRDLSFSSGLVVRTPTGGRSVGEGRTSLTPYLALWRNLGNRTGLHTYMGSEFPLGGFASDAPDAVLQYGIAPTVTVTAKDTPYWGNLTFFTEANGQTDLGSGNSSANLTLLPGARWSVSKDLWVATGYEFPVTGNDHIDSRIWLSLYLDF
jgi:hypothetical protein